MITRQIGSIIRGKATPFQIIAAAVLGCMLGFMPGFAQAAGLILALTFLLVVLNANLAIAALLAVGGKLLSLALAPVSFAVGRFLLDGPTGGLFQSMINAPVLALFGFDYYLTTGGLVLGLVVGVVAGLVISGAITRYRRKMATLEKDSERYQRYQSRKSVRFLVWLLAGKGHGKASYEQLLAKRVGNPVRTLGVVFVVLCVTVIVLLNQFVAGPILTAALQSGLERANGATVDVGSVDISLKENRLTVTGLAMADPKALDTDIFRATTLQADLSAGDLLRKRLKLDRVVVDGASSGDSRKVKGHLIGPPPEPEPDPKKPADVKSLEDYLKQAQLWKERLAQAKRWLEKISGPDEGKPAEPETPAEKKESLRERLEREVREKGYARVRASHLVEGSPTLTITEFSAKQVRVAALGDDRLDVEAHHLSTHPALLGKTPEVRVRSSSDRIAFGMSLASIETAGATNSLSFAWRGLPTDEIAGDLKIADTQPLQGGTIDLAADGSWAAKGGISINLPLQATLHGVDVVLPTGDRTKLDNFTLPIALTGPLDNPRIKVDEGGLSKALLAAGKQRAVNEATKAANKLLDEKVGGDLGNQGKNLLDNLLGGKKKDQP